MKLFDFHLKFHSPQNSFAHTKTELMGTMFSTNANTENTRGNNPQSLPSPLDYFFTHSYATPLVSYPVEYSNPMPLATYHGHAWTQPIYDSFHDSNLYNDADTVTGYPIIDPIDSQDYVHTATTFNSEVNVHRDSLRLEADEFNPDHFLVTFVFDAMLDGSITIYFFAKEHVNGRIVPLFPETFVPIKVSFTKGLRQEFRQPLGTGINFRVFSLDDLSNPSSRDDLFPIVISAETYPFEHIIDDRSYISANELPQMQVSQVIVEKSIEGKYDSKVIRQLLWSDNICYELREIYGVRESFDDNGSGKECTICMIRPKDIIVLPCRHLCMCRECANMLCQHSNQCPICREIIEELLQIEIDDMHFDHPAVDFFSISSSSQYM